MAVKKKIKTAEKKPKPTSLPEWKTRLFWGITALLALMGLIALAVSSSSLENDLTTLFGDESGIGAIFSSAVNDLENPIGIVGVLVSYLLISMFGKLFSLLATAILLVIAFQGFLNPAQGQARFKGFMLMLILFCVQIITIYGKTEHSFNQGWMPWGIWFVLKSLFSQIGALIIVIGTAILGFVMVFEYEVIKQKILEAWEAYARRKEVSDLERGVHIHTDDVTPKTVNSAGPSITDHVLAHTHETPEAAKPQIKEPKSELLQPVTPAPVKTAPAHPFPQPESLEEEEDNREYIMPSISDFLESPVKLSRKDREEIESQIKTTSKILMEKLAEFGVEAEVINVNIGPIITQYELRPSAGVKVSRFASLTDDLALAIKAKSIRVQAPIPGKGMIGIEIPNQTRDVIYLRDVLLSDEMAAVEGKLAFGLGKEISGKPIVTDLARMPHLLIAGATGSGKSVCINTIIMSLILRTKPEEMRMILIDPKRVELAGYNDLPHLIGDVVTDPETALETMYWAVKEMERRYELLQEMGVRDIMSFNEKSKETEEFNRLPYIVIIVDEFADLIMTSGKDIELPITRLAQMARAVGIHLILATQRPSIKVITGIIKANFPARIAFQVSSKVDSRVILDIIGAERLLGAGDMLFLPPGKATSERIHGAFVSDHEIERVCAYLRLQPKPKNEIIAVTSGKEDMGILDYDDELFPEAARLVVSANMASVSMLQRHFKVGYARAGRLIDLLEKAHIVGPHLGSKSRDVLASMDDLKAYGVKEYD